MPVSKRSAKRRQKLKKRGINTFNWASRKVQNLSQEELEALIKRAQLSVEQEQDIQDDM